MNKATRFISWLTFAIVVGVALASFFDESKDFDPVKIYDRNGRARLSSKIWRDTFTLSTGNAYSVDITSAGFTGIRTAAATVIQNVADPNQMASASVKSTTTSTVTVNITQPKSTAISLAVLPLTIDVAQFVTTPSSVRIAVVVFGD